MELWFCNVLNLYDEQSNNSVRHLHNFSWLKLSQKGAKLLIVTFVLDIQSIILKLSTLGKAFYSARVEGDSKIILFFLIFHRLRPRRSTLFLHLREEIHLSTPLSFCICFNLNAPLRRESLRFRLHCSTSLAQVFRRLGGGV